MDLQAYMQSLAEGINGSFSEYDEHTSVVVVPLEDGRYQSVKGELQTLDDGRTQVVCFSSYVCSYHENLNFRNFLSENQKLRYSKFSIHEEFVQVEASVFIEFMTVDNQDYLMNAIREIAEQADAWEHKLTGLDVF
jgi:hypothetical protein